jgi:signal transduction histidine kinase
MFGNLAENGAAWARSTVILSSWRDGDFTCIAVEDDGPGIPENATDAAIARGGRLGATKPGTGLGLAIVNDLADAYGGSLLLKRSALGGLRAELRFPSRQAENGATLVTTARGG